jgi:hypothetical protein
MRSRRGGGIQAARVLLDGPAGFADPADERVGGVAVAIMNPHLRARAEGVVAFDVRHQAEQGWRVLGGGPSYFIPFHHPTLSATESTIPAACSWVRSALVNILTAWRT